MPDNKYGQPYTRGPITPNVGSITTTPLTTGFPGLKTGTPLSQDDRINLLSSQVKPNDVASGKTYLSDVAGDLTGRYNTVVYGHNNEDAWAQQQSWLSKGANGILKGTNLAATTVVGSFATVGGALSSMFTGRLADIWDNPVMQGIDKWNNKVDQEYLPNYYSDIEKNANWYSKDNWMTANFLFDKVIKNSGFAAGVVISGNMAAGALGAAGTAIGEAASALDAAQSFKAFSPLLKSTARAFSVGQNIEAAAILEKEISSVADIAERTSKIAKIAAQENKFAAINDVGKRVGMAVYSQAGESAFEGLQTSNEFRNQLIDQHKKGNFGVGPNAEQLKKIDEQTEKVGKTSFLANMALLTATEYVQLPKLLGSSYAAEKQAANSLAGEVEDVVLKNGKYVAKETASKFGKVYNKVKGVGKYVFDPNEANQEILQYAVQVGTQNYYNKAFKGKDANVLVDGVLYGMFGTDEFGKGVGALNSKEGIEGGLIGGLTGGLMQAKANFQMSRATASNTANFLKELNNAPTYKEAFEYKMKAVNRGVQLQEEQENAVKQGDELEAKDINADMMHNYLAPRIKYGRMDMVLDDINDMRQSSSTIEGFAALKEAKLANSNDTSATFNARLNHFETVAKNTEQIFKSTNLRYSGELLKDKNGSLVLDTKGQPVKKYSDSTIDQLIYAASKVADYDLRIPQVSTLPLSNGIDVQSIVNDELTNPESNALDSKLAELNINPEVNTAQIKQNLNDVVELALRRKEYLKNYNDIITNPEKYNITDPLLIDEEGNILDENGKVVPKETVTVKVKDGKTGQVIDKQIEIGTQYLLGKVVKYDKDGNEVIQDPVLSILADNGDGTYKIKDNNGVRNVSAQVLEDYQLSKLSDITSDKKKNYVYVNRNNTFSNKLIKDANGNPVVGRLEYNANKDRLTFAYKNEQGKVIRSEVWNNMFKAKEGFNEAIITKVGEVTAEEAKASEDFVNAVTTVSQKLQTRNNIILDLYDKSVKRLDEITKKLNTSKERTAKAVEALENQLAAESLTKAGKPRKNQTPAMKKIINELSSLQDTLTKENEQLQIEKEELESNIPFFKDFLDNLESLPESGKEMIKTLKDDIDTLEDLIDITNQAIKDNDSLLKQIEDALMKALSIFNDYIKRLQEENPGVPLFIDALQANLEKVLGENGAQYYLDNKQGLTEQVIELESDINDFSSELKIPALSKKAEDLVKDIKDLKEGLDKLINEQIAKKEILDAFEQFAEDVKRQEEEAKQMQRNITLGQELLGTLTGSVQNFFGTRPYEAEAKKDKLDVVGSTKPTTEDTEKRPLPGYAARVNHFGARVSDMDNVDDLRGVIVTADTEDQILSGLVDNFLNEDTRAIAPARREEIRKEVIFLVVTENGQLVDKNGKLIPGKSAEETQEAYNKRLYDNAIFQVFPSASLTSKIKEKDGKEKIVSMFRDTVPQYERDSLKEQYKAWREAQIANTTLDKKGQKFKTSFGNLEFVKVWDDAKKEFVNDTATRTSAQDAGLLAKGILNRDSVVTVATNNDDKSEGKVSFNTPMGRVFLRIPGQGLVRLFNKKFTTTESETIFDAMLNLAKNASQNGSLYGGEKEEVNKVILSWLKSVVYWGIAKYPDGTRKKAGYNNIWFEDVLENGKPVKKLFMSGLQKDSQSYFDFTPQGLINSKQDILGLLNQMYANTDAKKVNIDAFNATYDEILRFDNLGNPVTRTWPNYQTYLLSANIVDSKGMTIGKRTGKEIPLTTQVRPLTSAEDTNRKGVYFTLNSSVEYNIPSAPVAKAVVVTPAPTVTPTAIATPQAPIIATPVVTPQQQPTPSGQFNLNGEVENNRIFGNGVGPIRFIFNSAKAIAYINSLSTDIFSIQGLLPAEISTAFFKNDIIDINADDVKFKIGQIKEDLRDKNPDLDDEGLTGKALNIAVSMIWKDVAPQVVAEMIPVQPAIADEAPVVEAPVVQPTAPISDIEVKKADIERRRQEELKEFDVFVKQEDSRRQKSLDEDFIKDTISKVNAKYNVELAALEGSVEEEVVTPEEVTPVTELPEGFINLDDIEDVDVDRSEMRVSQAIDKLDQFKPEQWNKVEEAMAKMLPNIPLYRVKNMIKGTNGRQAWGMLHDAAIYVYENAEEGTTYHEVFEAVWKMFAGPAQKQAIINEFKSRKGSFVDRETRKTVDYKDATDYQIKEQLAEEFREAILKDKLGIPQSSKTLIGRLFSQLIDAIKTFFTGENAQRNTKELFNNIGNGYYAQFNPYESQLSYAKKGVIDIENAQATNSSELRSATIPEVEMHDIIQHMTFLTLTKLSLNNESVFTVSDQDEKVLYPYLKLSILKLLAAQKKLNNLLVTEGKTTLEKVTRLNNNIDTLSFNIQNEWNDIIDQHKAHLKTFDVQFDENDEDVLNDENKSGRGDYQKADKIDSFRKANAALRLVLSTLPITKIVNGKPEWISSSIGGVTLIPSEQAHIDLTSKLHDSINIEDMFLGLKTMADSNPNYAALYRRMTGNLPEVGLDLSTIKEHDWQLMNAFWKSIKKQNADVITVFIQDNGDVVVSNSTLSSAAKTAKKDMINGIIQTIKNDESKYFRYAPAPIGKYYAKDNLKALEFGGKDLKPYVEFLKEIGINFNIREVEDLKEDQITLFKEAVQFMKSEMAKVGDKKIVKDEKNEDVEEDGGISVINTKSLNIDGDLFRLAIIKSIIENTEFQSTYFNINNERTQSFIGTNVISSLHNALSKVKNIEELQNDVKYKQYSYLAGLNDAFVQGSQMLKKMFDIVGPDSTGKRIKGTEGLLKPVIVDGMVDEQTGKKKESSKLTYRERLIQLINLNLSGVYNNLVPGDAALEHAIRMYNEKDPFVKETELFNKNYLDIFKDYFLSEVELAKENRNTVKNNGKDLRFFKAILGDDIHNKIMKGVNSKTDAEELYNTHKQAINSAIEQYIKEESEDVEDLLRTYDIVTTEDGQIKVDKVSLVKEGEFLTQAGLNMKLKALSINNMIANIEMHKLIYSDPYQYSDELKRIKNFAAPGEPLVNSSPEVNSTLDRLYNEGFKKGSIGWTDMIRDHFRSVTLSDVLSTNENVGYEDDYEETDGGGYITLKGVRVFKLRDGSWTSNNEKQYRFDIAFEELVKSGADENTINKFLKNNPGIKDTYTPIKPIVRGNKDNGRSYNDVVLHKFALVPLSFRVLYEMNPTSNAINLYNKMQKDDIDYAVYASGSKVGSEKISPLYDAEGKFDNTPFQDAKEKKGNLPDNVKRAVSNIPFAIVAVQSEVPSKDNPQVTQGSQITKLATMDYLESGVPVDFMSELPTFEERFAKWLELDDKSSYNEGVNIYNEIKNNQDLLEARIDEAVESLHKKLGMVETINDKGEKGYEIKDKEKLIKTLKDEIGKREINYNITDALEGFVKGDVVLEATPIYQQVRNILYSIADKTIVRPKISGGMKVQVSSALLESVKAKGEPVLDDKGKPALNKDGSPKLAYASTDLKFYKNEDGERVCEIMLGRWFKSNKTDKELMDYFNNDPEGKKELAAITGVAFRIPTQKQNSIDVFKIKQFLPKDFGDSVIIPSALVKKAGSDFDIDKLSIYLKNLFTDSQGKLRVIPFLGYGEKGKNEFYRLFDQGKLLSKSQIKELNDELDLAKSGKLESKPIEAIFGDAGLFTEEDILSEFIETLKENGIRDSVVDKFYKQSLENAYIQSLENLISHPLNYDNLVKPNDAKPLKDLSDDIQREMGYDKADFGEVGNMLSIRFMSNLRQSFVTGKDAIGIAAQGQVGHAQRQRSVVYIDTDRLQGDLIDETDKTILGNSADSKLFATDTDINFQEYNSAVVNGKLRPMLSWIKNKAGEYISDINGMFIDGYVDISKGDWIMKLGATPNVASTWLFLIDLGVPINTVGYFMNQPIIRDYLRSIENKGYSWLYIDDIIQDSLDSYNPSKEFTKSGTTIKGIPIETDLYKMLKYNNAVSKKDMNDLQKLQQQYMLKEFLKYSKMASHMFNVSQASNYDTASINDPYLVFKKMIQLEKARKTIISSVDDIIEGSFIKNLKDKIFDYRDAFS